MKRRDLLRQLPLAAVLAAGVLSATGAQAGGEAKKHTGGESYVSFNTLTGTMNRGGGRRGVLTVDVGLDVPDAKLRDLANQSLPRLRAAFVQVVVTYAAGLPPGSPPNPDVIGQALQRQADGVLGRSGARVLLGAVVAN